MPKGVNLGYVCFITTYDQAWVGVEHYPIRALNHYYQLFRAGIALIAGYPLGLGVRLRLAPWLGDLLWFVCKLDGASSIWFLLLSSASAYLLTLVTLSRT